MVARCLYAELDSISGSISQTEMDFKRLMNDLKLACLLYDEVYVSNSVFLHKLLNLKEFSDIKFFAEKGVIKLISDPFFNNGFLFTKNESFSKQSNYKNCEIIRLDEENKLKKQYIFKVFIKIYLV